MRSIILKLVVAGAVTVVATRLLDVDVGSVVAALETKLGKASTDAGALASGEYSRRMAARLEVQAAERLKEEVARLPDDESGDLNRELLAERKRILREKGERAERVVGDFVAGDLESLKRQVRENARLAGGDQ